MPTKAVALTARTSTGTDDLTLITGISRVSESRLHRAGIVTYAQLGSLDAEEIARVVEISAARIIERNWIGQAREFAAKGNPKEGGRKAGEVRDEGFVVDLFIGEDEKVVTTQVLHVKSNDGDSWAGWDGGRLNRFFAKHVGAVPREPEPATPSLQQSKVAWIPPERRSKLTLDDITIVPRGESVPCSTIAASQPFDVNISLSVSGSLEESGLPYTAGVHVRRLGDRSRLVLAEYKGKMRKLRDTIQVRIPAFKLTQGFYSLSTYVTAYIPESAVRSPLSAHALATRRLTVS